MSSLGERILALLPKAGLSRDEIVQAIPELDARIVRMRISNMVARDSARDVDGRIVGGGAPLGTVRRRKRRAPAPAVVESEPFDVALWLDGSVCIRGARQTADGSILIERDDAMRLARHILLGHRPPEAAGE